MYSGSRHASPDFGYGAVTLSGRLSQNRSPNVTSLSAVRTPPCMHRGLGSSAFARRYLRNRSFFLFLRVLRCFSSPGSPPYAMDLHKDTWSFSMWVSPFRHLRITGHVLLPAAFRSLSRLSSALSAKASALRPFCLTFSSHFHPCKTLLIKLLPLISMGSRPAGIALPAVLAGLFFASISFGTLKNPSQSLLNSLSTFAVTDFFCHSFYAFYDRFSVPISLLSVSIEFS